MTTAAEREADRVEAVAREFVSAALSMIGALEMPTRKDERLFAIILDDVAAVTDWHEEEAALFEAVAKHRFSYGDAHTVGKLRDAKDEARENYIAFLCADELAQAADFYADQRRDERAA